MKIKNVMWALALGIFSTACENDDNGGNEPMATGDYVDGILLTNEGPFNNGTGTVTFISNDLETQEDAIFNAVNSEDLGNIVQSIGFVENSAYIIANVSNKITVVNRFTFEKEAEITTGLNNPRYFTSANGKGYVTNWGDAADETDDYVAIIDLQTNTVEGSIPVVLGPEEIAAKDNTVYVAHQGAFGQNNQISVIDSGTNEVSGTITVGDVPNSMQFDAEGDLWVLAGGKPSFTGEETGGSISKIDTDTNEVTTTLDFGATEHPNHLSTSGGNFYYTLGGAIYVLSPSATVLPTASEIEDLNVYGMTTHEGRLYVTDAKDFASNGSLSIFDLSSKAEVKTFEVGIIPAGVYFN
ncbi:YncE family protein [Aggregatimonas sangjinii]|uniref:YncE family protein n=1 Tax=Aggregatimonas sangjinii TaxID=2583587 RepID=A0A5B7STZ4_9FLAO|nr:DUF5074 domain-containing protein [Aggregatimonas sangjinii]QCX00340.1 YncE family protein [Aggregatimonas sangjinii]